MLRRRLYRGKAGEEGSAEEQRWALPDLIVVDGGKGQLAADVAVLRELGLDEIPIAGLAKEREELFLPGRPDPVILPPTSSALYLVQRIRDEAHRFAITYHRDLRRRAAVKSAFDDLPGAGPGAPARAAAHVRVGQARPGGAGRAGGGRAGHRSRAGGPDQGAPRGGVTRAGEPARSPSGRTSRAGTVVASPADAPIHPRTDPGGPWGRPHHQLLAQPDAARHGAGGREPRGRDEARPRSRRRPPGRVPGPACRWQVAGRCGDGHDEADRREPGQQHGRGRADRPDPGKRPDRRRAPRRQRPGSHPQAAGSDGTPRLHPAPGRALRKRGEPRPERRSPGAAPAHRGGPPLLGRPGGPGLREHGLERRASGRLPAQGARAASSSATTRPTTSATSSPSCSTGSSSPRPVIQSAITGGEGIITGARAASRRPR